MARFPPLFVTASTHESLAAGSARRIATGCNSLLRLSAKSGLRSSASLSGCLEPACRLPVAGTEDARYRDTEITGAPDDTARRRGDPGSRDLRDPRSGRKDGAADCSHPRARPQGPGETPPARLA